MIPLPRLRLLALATLLSITLPAASSDNDEAPGTPSMEHRYFDLRRERADLGSAEAGREKALLCATCHGETGTSSVAPMIPDLAGQRADFLYWEMLEYKRGTLTESPMTVLMADITTEDIRDLAAFYASQERKPHPADDSIPPPDPALLARGEALYMNGNPDKGIPPCQGCHGADARGFPHPDTRDRTGNRPYAAYPGLRSQRDVYLQSRLTAFREGRMRYSTTDFVMTGIGKRLDDESIHALSTWLSHLPPGQ